MPFLDDMEVSLSAVEEFLGEKVYGSIPTAAVHTILFTDLEGSTALTNRLGDAKAQELLHLHDAVVRSALRTHGGIEIKHTGDGIMASFGSAVGAVECAVAIQRALASHPSVRVKIGLNAGEPIAEHGDIFGASVQLARRVCDHASGGEILATNVVRELCAGKNFPFADAGVPALKGFEDSVRLFSLRWRE
jgi:class 3 adenylate cyclase